MDSYSSVQDLRLGIQTPGWGSCVTSTTIFALHCFVLPSGREIMQRSTVLYLRLLNHTIP